MDNFLSRYQELLGKLNKSKAKQRRGNDGGRSALVKETEDKQKQATYKDYSSDFETTPGMHTQALVPYYNPKTGAEWSAPSGGYTPKPGTGWVKGYKPEGTISTPPKSSTRIDERYQSIREHFKNNPPQEGLFPIVHENPNNFSHYKEKGLFPKFVGIEYENPNYKQIPGKTPTAFTNPNSTKNVLNRMANF